MRKLVTFALAIILAAKVSLALSAPEASPPSLSETLAWMDSTFNPHVVEGGSYGYGVEETYSRGELLTRRTETLNYNGCAMTLHIQEDPAAYFNRQIYTSSVITFHLEDIDPLSIREFPYVSRAGGLDCAHSPNTMVCDMERVEFQTRNKVPRISIATDAVFLELQGADRQTHTQSKSFVSVLLLDNVEYAARFVMAFRHAVELCGGKPSAF